MFKRNQVFEVRCCVKTCDEIIGCYDSYRMPKRMACKVCTDICPIPNENASHSYCDSHLDVTLNAIKAKMGELNEGFEFEGHPM